MVPTDPKDIIQTEDQLETLLGAPFQPSLDKEIDRLDQICKDFIARSPFLVIASSDGSAPDISPRGDAPGFVQILDDTHIALPDRPGNRRFDTLRRILRDPKVALLFFVPGMGETLRVYGTAKLVTSMALRKTMSVGDKVPTVVAVIEIDRAMYHCPKCTVRSGLWDPDKWPSTEGLTAIGPAMQKHANLKVSLESLEEDAERAGVIQLY